MKIIAEEFNSINGKQKKPMFDIPEWNFYERVINEQPLTTNGIEYWHSSKYKITRKGLQSAGQKITDSSFSQRARRSQTSG